MSGWQPIETAPRDGTWIHGCNDRGNQAVIIWTERGLGDHDVRPGWIHPFTNGRLSPFWQGLRVVYWKPLPKPPSYKRLAQRQRERMKATNAASSQR